MMPQQGFVRPAIGDIALDSPLLLPPGFQLLNWVTNWRTSWSHIVAGKFSDSPYSALLCYDRDNGFAAFYQTDGLGRLQLLKEHDDWRNSWTHVVPGVFGDSGYDGALLYDQQAGLATFYDSDGQGSLVKLQEHTWNKSWTHIVAAPFVDSRYSAFLLYDQSAGVGAIYSTDGRGGITLVREYDNWRTTWTHIVAGEFYFAASPTASAPYPLFADLFFFEGSTGYGETYFSDGRGGISMLGSQSGFPRVSDVLVGNFGCFAWTSDSGPQEWNNLLFFDRVSHSGTIFAFGDAPNQPNTWLPVEKLFAGTRSSLPVLAERRAALDSIGTVALPPSPPWSLIVAGNFWMADEEDKYFGTSGQYKYPQYRYFYSGGFTDLFFYDRDDGYAAVYLKESAQTTPLEPLAGYVSNRSVFPQETITFHVSSQIGPYGINVYRQGANLVFMGSVLVDDNAARPYGVSRTAFCNGAGWPPVASLTIPPSWPSGLYLARVEVGGPPDTGPGSVAASATERTSPTAGPIKAVSVSGTRPTSRTSVFGNPVILDIPFVVRAATPGSRSSILLAVADTTYEAYNYWGGRSLYGHSGKGVTVDDQPTINHIWVCDILELPKAFRVSFLRPFLSVVGYSKLQTFEIPFIQWLDRHGFRVDVCAVSDLHSDPHLLDNYNLFVSIGHDEYWSDEMRTNVEDFVTNGGNAAFFSGNVCWWRVRFDDKNTIVCYKNKNLDPDTIEWGDLGRSSASMTGVSGATLWPNPPNPLLATQYFVAHDAEHWTFAETGVQNGDAFGVYWTPDHVLASVVGPETDTRAPNTPSNFHTLASAYMQDTNSLREVATMGTFEKHNGGTVFTAATINWALGLSQQPGVWGVVDQITWNVFSRLS